MRYRNFVLGVLGAGLLALVPGLVSAAGATLTVPVQVQSNAGASPVVQPSFSYPEATPFCTVGVDFTWDGAAWVSEFPTKNGELCVASGVNIAAPAGHFGAGAHQVCGSAGPQFKDCKTVTVVASSQPAPKTSGGADGGPAPAQQAPATTSTAATPTPVSANAPAPERAIALATHLPVQAGIGLVVLVIAVIAAAAVLMRQLALRRSRKAPSLPSPGVRR